MSLSGTKVGTLQTVCNCGGLGGNTSINLSGSSAPNFGLTAPAALIGTVGTNGSSSATLALNDPSQTVTTSSKLAVFWVSGGVLQCAYDLSVASVSFSTPTNTATITQSGGAPSVGTPKFWAASGSAPTALPTGTTAISVAIAQDLTQSAEGVTVPGGTGANIQQLIAVSSQPGLISWQDTAGGTEERLSAITTANGFDTWPTTANQVGSLPTGSASSNNWQSGHTVTVIRCYNLGSTVANVGVSSQAATMQAGVILA